MRRRRYPGSGGGWQVVHRRSLATPGFSSIRFDVYVRVMPIGDTVLSRSAVWTGRVGRGGRPTRSATGCGQHISPDRGGVRRETGTPNGRRCHVPRHNTVSDLSWRLVDAPGTTDTG